MSGLSLWLPQDLSAPWPWHDGDGSGLASSATEKAVLGARAGKDAVVIVPGQWVRIFSHDLPKMRERERLSAAKFSIEDKLAAPLEAQHCVIGADTDQRIAVMAREKMDAVITALSAAGLGGARLCADFDILQGYDGPIKLADRIIMPGALGQSVDLDMAQIAGAPQGLIDARLADVAAALTPERALNLRSGDYAAKGAGFGRIGAKEIMRAAVLLAALGLSYGLWEASKIRAAQAHIAELKAQSRAIYTQATGEQAPANVGRAVTRALNSGGGEQADFLVLSSALFRALESVDGVMIDSVQFDAARGQLNLRLIYPSFEAASAVEQAARAQGVTFRPGGVREQGGQRIGDAVLTGGAS